MTHIMIDLETMGTSHDAPIFAIGAVAFSRKQGIIGAHYTTNTLKSAVDLGAKLDPDTVTWWMRQSKEAQNALTHAKNDLTHGLTLLAMWMGNYTIDGVWGNGAAFDNVILSNAYRMAGRLVPWHYHQDRCYRTMNALYGSDIEQEAVGTAHNAVDDAEYQARRLLKIWDKIGGPDGAV